eukprot:4690577-Alexandrium_andersonii.AAC.1
MACCARVHVVLANRARTVADGVRMSASPSPTDWPDPASHAWREITAEMPALEQDLRELVEKACGGIRDRVPWAKLHVFLIRVRQVAAMKAADLTTRVCAARREKRKRRYEGHAGLTVAFRDARGPPNPAIQFLRCADGQ